MQIEQFLKQIGSQALKALYGLDMNAADLTLNETKPEFEGDYTLVLFSFVKSVRKAPEQLGNELGTWLLANHGNVVSAFNVIKGFLNLTVADTYWYGFLQENSSNSRYGFTKPNGRRVMVEYSSPNTNKPLHLGHLRNNFLGWSVAEIYKANGYDVWKTCVVNDRGIHICKSMLAWQKFANGATPQSTQTKGDHFVGDYYVRFENALKKEAQPLADALVAGDIPEGLDEQARAAATAIWHKLQQPDLVAEKREELTADLKEIARNATVLMKEVREMLRKWEMGDAETVSLWEKMNSWVYEGFSQTYKRIGSNFTKTYYESEVYLLGKHFVEEGLGQGVFYKKDDGSVWIDLSDEGLDEKLVLRKDGTSVYITQDIGLARLKYEDYPMEQSLYVIADEQNYHMKVLQLICKKLGMPFAEGIHHLSYGMVDLPSGRMKSREGTVVDADDLCDEMEQVAAAKTAELGKVDGFEPDELKALYHTLGMGALKYYLLRVDPKKRMVFNPEESIDFHGHTGPFIQYTYARTRSVLRKVGDVALDFPHSANDLYPLEKQLLVHLEKFPGTVADACLQMDPSVVANYVYGLAKIYNSFYTEHKVANAESEAKKALRVAMCQLTATVINNGMGLLGIEVPERM